MIEVDIYVSEMSKEYSFSIDENAQMNVLSEEIGSMVAQKEQIEFRGNTNSLLFYDKSKGIILDGASTPSELGIRNGDKICLI